jgi:GDSL-like Lipase/Acylhydrolase family
VLCCAACHERPPQALSPAAAAASVAAVELAPEQPLRAGRWSESDARRVFPIEAGYFVFDEWRGFTRRPSTSRSYVFGEHPAEGFSARTNALAMREDAEPSAARPDLRVLVTGDSHTDGACENAESFANRAEALLAARKPGPSREVLNAGCGSYSFYNYLGVLERCAGLDPDVFVVCVYGGNDWGEALAPWHHHHGTQRPESGGDYDERLSAALAVHDGWGRQAVSQSHNQYLYFQRQPEQLELGLRAGVSVCEELRRRCAEARIRLIVAYLPPMVDVQRARLLPHIDDVDRRLGLDASTLAATDALADRFMAWCADAGIETLDLRPTLRAAADEPLYWRTDLHLAVEGHERVARALVERLDAAR